MSYVSYNKLKKDLENLKKENEVLNLKKIELKKQIEMQEEVVTHLQDIILKLRSKKNE